MVILEIGMSNTDNILQLLGVFILFIIICVITYYTTRFVAGVKLGQARKGNFKVIDTYKITQNKYLQIVQIGSRYFVIAIGKDDIRYITELQESDITLQDQQSLDIKNTFADVFSKVRNKYGDKIRNDQNFDESHQNKDQK